MAKLQDLEKYLNHTFSTGYYTPDRDYLSFQRKYINYLRSICKENDWILVKANKSHYFFSAFIKDVYGLCVYISISDVRFWKNEWYNNVLIRDAKDENDYHGGRNNYIELPHLPQKIKSLLVPY